MQVWNCTIITSYMLIYLDLCHTYLSLLIERVTFCMLWYIRVDWVRFWLIQCTIIEWTKQFRKQGVRQTGQQSPYQQRTLCYKKTHWSWLFWSAVELLWAINQNPCRENCRTTASAGLLLCYFPLQIVREYRKHQFYNAPNMNTKMYRDNDFFRISLLHCIIHLFDIVFLHSSTLYI